MAFSVKDEAVNNKLAITTKSLWVAAGTAVSEHLTRTVEVGSLQRADPG